MREASGEVVVFLDDDMRPMPDLLEAHAAAQERHPGCAVIGNALTAPELGPSLVYDYLDSRGVHKLPPDSPMPARYFLTNNASVPRRAFDDAGLFDESFRSYGFEDMEIAFRLEERAGLGFRYCPEAVAHHIHEHTLQQLLAKRREAARSSLPVLLEKHPGRVADLSLTALLPPDRTDAPGLRLRKLAFRLASLAPLPAIARVLARVGRPGPFAFRLLDYLIADAYARGLRDARKPAGPGPV